MPAVGAEDFWDGTKGREAGPCVLLAVLQSPCHGSPGGGQCLSGSTGLDLASAFSGMAVQATQGQSWELALPGVPARQTWTWAVVTACVCLRWCAQTI